MTGTRGQTERKKGGERKKRTGIACSAWWCISITEWWKPHFLSPLDIQFLTERASANTLAWTWGWGGRNTTHLEWITIWMGFSFSIRQMMIIRRICHEEIEHSMCTSSIWPTWMWTGLDPRKQRNVPLQGEFSTKDRGRGRVEKVGKWMQWSRTFTPNHQKATGQHFSS